MNYLKYEVINRIAFITLNRPEKRNALSHELVSELMEAFDAASIDEAAKIVVLCAEGEAFCAGADLAYLQKLQSFSYEENVADSNHLKDLFLKIYTLNKVVIAQIQGHALAGGCGLAAVCDFSFTVPEAKFGYTEVRIGFIPAIVMVFLLRRIGEGKSKQLLLSGDLISAEEACNLGLVNYLSTVESLEQDVLDFANKLIRSNSAQSMAATKQMVAAVQSMPLTEALNYASSMNAKARGSEDCQRGIAAFLNKEKLIW
ncbi:methylglutaconyl-CoA hydratase [Chryseotalea sanaruensis]|uniref:Methylglutaconyl-CoA hydratase n=1 Tax=Chryseotalea sanaruensis TaxID=2482724 RepID=A0A401UA87_9BACT|nr:enoyl-CoA hydratase-related protein [Chryseotalea sanaruensis]GCC51823.1 methylglutaconyl-CoA hydratase [Chryseotalea sanaruensis]